MFLHFVFFHFLFLFQLKTSTQTVILNENRTILFGDILEPMFLVNWNGTLSESQIVQLYHEWEQNTTTKIGSSSNPEDYRKAMPCFPGPSIFSTSISDGLPRIPSCQVFVNYSMSILEETQDFLALNSKGQNSTTIQNITSSLKNRIEGLKEYIPDGATKYQLNNFLGKLENTNISQKLQDSSNFNISSIIPCIKSSLSISMLKNLNETQTISQFLCSYMKICSYSDLQSNSCFGKLNITEEQYINYGSQTISNILEDFGIDDLLSRERRTISPEIENSTGIFEGGKNRPNSWPQKNIKNGISIIKSCLNSSILSNLNTSQTISEILCENLEICSYSEFSSNTCFGALNITEEIFDEYKNMTISEVFKGADLFSRKMRAELDNSTDSGIIKKFRDSINENSGIEDFLGGIENSTSVLSEKSAVSKIIDKFRDSAKNLTTNRTSTGSGTIKKFRDHIKDSINNETEVPNSDISEIKNCLNISMLTLKNINTSQTINNFLCKNLEICSFSDLNSKNSCTKNLNITEEQYEKYGNMTISDIIGNFGGIENSTSSQNSAVSKIIDKFRDSAKNLTTNATSTDSAVSKIIDQVKGNLGNSTDSATSLTTNTNTTSISDIISFAKQTFL
ncbi:unnamed protein product [Caenorhabditis angaria]|uniref:SXP/RAL-2 family protein Ani s 5-like cation-binding domain-containing protein n=1 Tax=Caenorhabditis angaria TaxID=860376 RepID=A0A9P1IKG3_9PELO|nr:unnamed protein product [Caenorhabditis angaria]